MNNYEEIINLNHYNPKFHPRMSIYNRSAQFAPFAALTGYDEAIIETARITDEKIELNDDLKNLIDMKLHILEKQVKNKPRVKIIYFENDKRKCGGKYKEYIDVLKRINNVESELIFINGVKIKFDCILDINIEENL